jgi:hypothetical protein
VSNRVELSPQEMVTAATIGVRRQVAKIVGGYGSYLPNETNDWAPFDNDVHGAMCEFVIARKFNLFWAPNIGDRKAVDVGGIIEVRGRRLSGSGLDLGLRDIDKLQYPFVLVHTDPPFFNIIGWIDGREGWRIGQGNSQLHYVPHKIPPLRPIDELWEVVHRRREENRPLVVVAEEDEHADRTADAKV